MENSVYSGSNGKLSVILTLQLTKYGSVGSNGGNATAMAGRRIAAAQFAPKFRAKSLESAAQPEPAALAATFGLQVRARCAFYDSEPVNVAPKTAIPE